MRLAAPDLGCLNLEELVQMKMRDGSFRTTLETRTVALRSGEPAEELFAFLFNPFRVPAVTTPAEGSAEGSVRDCVDHPTCEMARFLVSGTERLRKGMYLRTWSAVGYRRGAGNDSSRGGELTRIDATRFDFGALPAI
jgi:hypothetical protein